MALDATPWFAMIDGEQVGPMSTADLARHFAAGEIEPGVYVWRDGMEGWRQAKEVEELAAVFAPTKPPSLRLPPPPPPAAARVKKGQPADPKRIPDSHVFLGRDDEADGGHWKEPTNVEPLPFGEPVHQQDIASVLFTDPGSKPAGRTTGSFALDISAWAARGMKSKPPAETAAAANPAGPGAQPASASPRAPANSGISTARIPTTALRQPLAPAKSKGPVIAAAIVGAVLLACALGWAIFVATK